MNMQVTQQGLSNQPLSDQDQLILVMAVLLELNRSKKAFGNSLLLKPILK